MGRVTLQGALRLDIASSIFPEAAIGGVRFLPTVISFPETKGVDAYKDLTPRGGVAIDLFGNGKTAVKFNFGRYLEAAQNGGLFIASRPTSRISTTASRTWTDSNGNFQPDCDLLNNAAQNGRHGGDFCGAVGNTNFGKSLVRYDAGSGAAQRLGRPPGRLAVGRVGSAADCPGMSLELSYLRRWLNNFIVTDNLAMAASDHDTFTISAPVDSRLPDGGGYADPRPLYNMNPSKASVATNNFVTLDSTTATRTQTSNAIALNLSARPRNGLVFQGGFNTNNTSFDYCSLRAAIPELVIAGANNPTNPYCSYSTGWHDAVHGPRLVHDSEDRRADRRHGEQRSGRPARGELGGAQLGHRAVARPEPLEQRANGHGQPDRARGRCTATASTRLDLRFAKIIRSSAGHGRTSASTSTTC